MEKIEKIKKEALGNKVPILKDKSLEYIEQQLKEIKPKKILEIGTAVGYSVINMCKVLLNEEITPTITTVELNKSMSEIAKQNIMNEELEKYITVINQDGFEYMQQLVSLKEKFDYIFIDAAKGQYVKYLNCAIELTDVGGYIVADNVLFRGMVLGNYNEHKYRTIVNRLREYIDIVTSDERLESKILDIGDGIAVSKKIKS